MTINERKSTRLIHNIRETYHLMIGAMTSFFLLFAFLSYDINGFMWIQIALIITPVITLGILNLVFHVDYEKKKGEKHDKNI